MRQSALALCSLFPLTPRKPPLPRRGAFGYSSDLQTESYGLLASSHCTSSIMELSMNPRRVAKVLGGLICTLAVFSLLGQYSAYFLGHGRLLGFVHQFDLGAEGNIATYVATVLLLLAAVLLGIIARFAWQRTDPYRWHWTILSLIFVYMSVDEFARIHESLNQPMQEVVEAEGLFYYPWVIPAMGVVLLVGIAYIRFFWQLSRRWKLLFGGAAILYVTGAVGVELFGARYISVHGDPTFAYELLVTAEEVLEMLGVALFIYALLEYLREHDVEVHLSVEKEQESASPASTDVRRRRRGVPSKKP